MKHKNLMFLALSCTLLVILGLGVSIIYSDYIYNPAKGLISINIAWQSGQLNPEWEPGMKNPTSPQDVVSFMQEIDSWANEANATVFYKTAFSAGCGYSDYSGWLLSTLGISKAEDETANNNGVYITESNSFRSSYVKDGILLPGVADLQISGTYHDVKLPPTLANCDYLYPLTMAATADGVYFTDTQEIDTLLKLFDDNGYEVLHIHRPLSFFDLVKRMLSDGMVTRAAACAMVGLLFCFIYGIVLLYRENLKSLRIRHIFGLSKKQILLGSVCIAVLIDAVAVGIISIVLFRGLAYMSRHDLNRLFCYIAVGITTLSIGTSLVCAASANKVLSNSSRR